ncbi:MAG: tetratricopeptide repeat protein [Fuerstiella sp.]
MAASTSAPVAAGTSDRTSEGWELWKKRELQDAELAFLDAVQLNKDDANAWNGLGWCRSNTGRHEQAVKAFRECLALNPNHGAAMNGIGQSSIVLEDWKTAEDFLLKSGGYFEKTYQPHRDLQTTCPQPGLDWLGCI